MVRRERTALALVLLILIGLPLAALGYQFWLRPVLVPVRVIDIQAAAPENGGFQPDSIQVRAGENVTLRFHSTDVTHGIAIGPGLGVDLGDVDPGQVKEVTLTFSEGGTFTFYCNTWCSRDHWRMRGVVEVVATDGSDFAAAQPDPFIERLIAEGIDIDAAHSVDMEMESMPDPQSDAGRGGTLFSTITIPEEIQSIEWRRTHTPQQAVDLLASANPDTPKRDLIDVVAYLWLRDIDSTQIADAMELYNKNCAACHGETGDGGGPNADETAEDPAAFADTAYMWQMRPDVLYAKIRRGGMGTDMPNFGTLFTPAETWIIVDYLWSIALSDD